MTQLSNSNTLTLQVSNGWAPCGKPIDFRERVMDILDSREGVSAQGVPYYQYLVVIQASWVKNKDWIQVEDDKDGVYCLWSPITRSAVYALRPSKQK
jgi:hypothetical protein